MVNLKDLIKQLQFYEELDRKQSLKNAHERAKRRVRSYARLTPDDIVNLAHDEYIEKSVDVLHENFSLKYLQIKSSLIGDFPCGPVVKNQSRDAGTQVLSLVGS